jgi:hypothetical protein
LKIKDTSFADFGIDVMTDDGIKQLTPAKKVFTVDNYNKMLESAILPEQNMSSDDMSDDMDEEDYEIFINEEGVKKVRTAGGDTYPIGTPEYAKIVGKPIQEENMGLQIAMRPVLNFNILRVEFPLEIINELNEHIDDVIIPNSKSFADGLVGQLKQDKRSAQLDFPFDTDVGKELEVVFNQIGTTYLKKGYERDSQSEVIQCWTNHAYAGDYNPFHDHGVRTMAGLSGFLWLKVPKCIEDSPDVPKIHNAAGGVDGWTHLCWGTNTMRDLMQLRPQTEDYIKPVVGTMLIFPQWLKHQVMPFFGEGERRSIAMNWNVNDSEEERKKYMSDRESKLYDAKKKSNEC